MSMSLCFLRFELPTRDFVDMSRRKYEFKDVEVTADKDRTWIGAWETDEESLPACRPRGTGSCE
jgi:hypothetical protein